MFFKKKYKTFFFIIICFLIGSCSNNKTQEKLYSKDICPEPIAPFFYENNNERSISEIKFMCKCLWNKLPENGWERKVSIKLYKGEDIGWKIKSFSTIFEKNYSNCSKELVSND